MNFTVETDFGHDADDLVALSLLAIVGYQPEVICVAPGHPAQLEYLDKFCSSVNWHTSIYPSTTKHKVDWKISGSYRVLDNYPTKKRFKESASDALVSAWNKETTHLIIGPPKATGIAIQQGSPSKIGFQGGFVPYSTYRPKVALEKFENVQSCPSFNPNGAIEETRTILQSSVPIDFVTKAICHSFVGLYCCADLPNCPDMTIGPKGMHDLLAVLMLLKPDLFVWLNGEIKRESGGWTFKPSTRNRIAVDYDREGIDKFLKELHIIWKYHLPY